MKQVRIAMWLIVVSVGVSWAFGVGAAPQIEFPEGTTFDFGKAGVNEKLTHTFVFENTGDSTLKIDRLKAG